MQVGALGAASRQGHVDALTAQARLEGRLLKQRTPRRDRFKYGILGDIDLFAGGLAVFGRQFAQLLELLGNET